MDPNQVIPLRTSERLSFKTCRQQWEWGYLHRLKTKKPQRALRFGSLVHAALQVYYKPGRKRGKHPAKAYEKLYKEQLESGMPEFYMDEESNEVIGDPVNADRVSGLEFGVEILKHYISVYGADDFVEVLQPEQAFQIDVHHPKTGEYLFTYVGEMDVVIRNLTTGKIGLFEHKTSANNQPFGAPLTLDEQSSAYWTFGAMWLRATGKIPEGEDMEFMLYNFLRKAMPDQRPQNPQGLYLNKDGTVSKRQPAPYFRREMVYRGEAERAHTFRRALNEFREMNMVRQGRLAVYKNPDRHCGWCQFRDMCEVHETGSDWKALRSNMFTKWNPYDVHEVHLSEKR